MLAQVTENERRESFRIEGGGVWQPTLVTAKGRLEAATSPGFPRGASPMVSTVAVDEPDGEEEPEGASELSEFGLPEPGVSTQGVFSKGLFEQGVSAQGLSEQDSSESESEM